MPSSALRPPAMSSLFPYTTLFRSCEALLRRGATSRPPPAPRRRARMAASAEATLESIQGLLDFGWWLRLAAVAAYAAALVGYVARLDRKSTRLNSSHRCISYAVFCSPATSHVFTLSLHDALPIL